MQIKCDRCGQKYSVDDARISPQGAKIKCPSCANIFVVKPPKDNAATSGAAANPNDSSLKMQTPIQPKAAADPKPEQPKSAEEEWRIQNIGLTYTFHDLDSLHSWLAGRPTLEGVKVARGKDDWKELGDYPDVMTTELITKFFPLGDVPSSKSPKTQTAEITISKETTLNGAIISDPLLSASSLSPIVSTSGVAPISKATDLSTAVTSKSSMQQLKKERAKAKQARQNSKKQIIIFSILAALLVVTAVFMMRYWRTGEIPFLDKPAKPDTVAAQPAEPEPAAPVAQKPKEEVPPPPQPVVENTISYDEIARLAEEDYQKQLNEARDMINQRKWPEARATLESMLQEHTDDPDLLQLMAKTYRGLGMTEKANAMDAAAKKALAAKKELEKKQAEAIHIGD